MDGHNGKPLRQILPWQLLASQGLGGSSIARWAGCPVDVVWCVCFPSSQEDQPTSCYHSSTFPTAMDFPSQWEIFLEEFNTPPVGTRGSLGWSSWSSSWPHLCRTVCCGLSATQEPPCDLALDQPQWPNRTQGGLSQSPGCHSWHVYPHLGNDWPAAAGPAWPKPHAPEVS